MKPRIGLAILAVAAIWLGLAPAASAAAQDPNPSSQCSAAYFQNDPRLGPLQLPDTGPVAAELRDYQRTGGLSVSQFLATYWNPAANGGLGAFIFPPDNGYVIGPNGQPEVSQLTLQPGTAIDRYGSEFGAFLNPAGLKYAKRSNPPQNLDNISANCNYHRYTVLKSFAVDTGPVAPWFGQPGGGTQYQLVASLVPGAPTPLNVMFLVNNGYLERIS